MNGIMIMPEGNLMSKQARKTRYSYAMEKKTNTLLNTIALIEILSIIFKYLVSRLRKYYSYKCFG